jgi:uncharacterized SAM-binding protein YcdF (DUF218 family)
MRMIFSRKKETVGRRGKIIIGLLLLALVILFLIPAGINQLGKYLMVEDPLEKSAAIVVLGGDFPYRALEGASLYLSGWAPEVWVTTGVMRQEEKRALQIGVQYRREEAYNQEALELLGVPAGKIHPLEGQAQNTTEEVRLIAGLLKDRKGDRVILVTSKPHSRRLKATWRALVGDSPRAIVRYAREDPFDPESWWRYTDDALSVIREVFGILNVWAGFPMKPKVR